MVCEFEDVGSPTKNWPGPYRSLKINLLRLQGWVPGRQFFPEQFTVGVLNATLDLAALVLVGVAAFLGSEVVLSPVVSGCLPSCGGWVWPHLEQKYSEIKITGFNLNLLTVNCLGSTLV